MRRVLLLLGTATATVALAWWLAGLPDDVTLRIGPLIIETRSGLALLGGALLSILLLLALRLVLAILNIPTRLRAWHAAGRRAPPAAAAASTAVPHDDRQARTAAATCQLSAGRQRAQRLVVCDDESRDNPARAAIPADAPTRKAYSHLCVVCGNSFHTPSKV